MVHSSKKCSINSLSRSPPSKNFDGVNPSSEAKDDDNLQPIPVEPDSSGKGFPYAPENWPNPGDTWGWSVGKGVRGSGYCAYRRLYLPHRLLESYPVRCFSSKVSVKRFIQKEFPGADVNAFFASFTWKIPAKMKPPSELNRSSDCLEFSSPEETVKVENEAVEEVHGKTSRKRKQSSVNRSSDCLEFSSPEETVKVENEAVEEVHGKTSRKMKQSAVNRSSDCLEFSSPEETVKVENEAVEEVHGKTSRKMKQSAASIGMSTSKDLDDSSCSETDQIPSPGRDDLRTPQKSLGEKARDDFVNYLNSLDDILAPPHSKTQFSSTKEHSLAEDEIAESRRELSSFLTMDFPCLASSENLPHMVALASKILKDPRVGVDELIKLKLIEEIPLISKTFLETEETLEKSNNFFANLDANIAKVYSRKEQYKKLKEIAFKLMKENDSNALILENMENQIAQLVLQREEISSIFERQKKKTIEVHSTLNTIADTVPVLVCEIMEAYSERAEWEIKKTTSSRRKSEILARFASLKGYSFLK